MGRDEEFTAWAAGQWQRLLRSAVLLGCTLAEAEDVAQATLVRCYVKWSLVRRSEHRTAYVAQVLLSVHREAARKRSAGELPVAVVPDGPASGDEAERLAAVDAVSRALADLSVPSSGCPDPYRPTAPSGHGPATRRPLGSGTCAWETGPSARHS